MLLPRTISKTGFKIGELAVSVCPDEWTPPSAYGALVNAAWDGLLAHATQQIWDGTYYRVLAVQDFDRGTIRLGTIRYRYIATFPALHQHHARLQLEPLHHLSTIALVRTRDAYYLLGRRAGNGKTDLIGGGVQADELEIASGADIERNLLKEIHEETGLNSSEIDHLEGIGILLSGTSNVLIVGHANVGLTKAEAIARFALRTDEEMSEPVFIPEGELDSALHAMTDYRPLISELMSARPAVGLQ